MISDSKPRQAQRLWPRWFVAGAKPVKADLGPAGTCPLVDISGGGMRVQALAPLRRGAEVPVRIDVPGGAEALQCSGVVVWSKPNGAAGIRFAGLSDFQKNVLQGWLADLEKAATAPTAAQPRDEFTSVVTQIRAAQLSSADALNTIVRRVQELPKVSGSAIALGTAENMVCMAAAGAAPEVGASIPAVIGLTGECVFKRRMVYCQDAKRDPRVGRELDFGSVVILPLVVNNEVRGVMEVFSSEANAFDDGAVDVLEKLADAVVFVTYGIVTQRRLTTAKSSMPGPSASLGPKQPAPLSPLTAGWSTAEHTAGGNGKGDEVTLGTAPATAASMAGPQPGVSVASQPATPKMAPVPMMPVRAGAAAPWIAEPVAVRTAAKLGVITNVSPRPRQERRAAEHSSKGKWVVVAVVVVSAACASYFVGQRRAQTATAVNLTPASSPPLEAASASAPISVEAGLATADAGPALSAPKQKLPAAPTRREPDAKREAKPAAEHVNPQPAPIVLAASTAPPSEENSPVEVAAPVPIPESASVPQIAIPSENTLPSLARPQVKLRTGGALLKKVEPIYPSMARNARIQGDVELRFVVQKDGTVAKIERLSGQPILASAAVEAVKQWRYDPVKMNGQPIEVPMTVKLKFDLYR